MTIVSIKPESREETLRIELSDGSLFSFKPCYLPPVFIDEGVYTPDVADGREINSSEEEAFRFASACLRAEKAALQLIARAEQTVYGLSGKLAKRGHDSACIRAVITRLTESGLLDNNRYARLWLESRISRQGTSPRRLLSALCAKGIDLDDATAILKETLDDETELRLLERYVRKQSRKNPAAEEDTPSARRELKYQLKNEGFSSIAIETFLES
jgi:regulatory protein